MRSKRNAVSRRRETILSSGRDPPKKGGPLDKALCLSLAYHHNEADLPRGKLLPDEGHLSFIQKKKRARRETGEWKSGQRKAETRARQERSRRNQTEMVSGYSHRARGDPIRGRSALACSSNDTARGCISSRAAVAADLWTSAGSLCSSEASIWRRRRGRRRRRRGDSATSAVTDASQPHKKSNCPEEIAISIPRGFKV